MPGAKLEVVEYVTKYWVAPATGLHVAVTCDELLAVSFTPVTDPGAIEPAAPFGAVGWPETVDVEFWKRSGVPVPVEDSDPVVEAIGHFAPEPSIL